MRTILSGTANEVVIDTEGPVVIIGESINPTRRKRLATALREKDFSPVLELALTQISSGADILDVNVGFPGVDDEKLLPEVVKAIQDNFDIPLCIDSPNPAAIEAALKAAKGKCLINSVNGNESSLRSLLPVASEYGAAIIALCIDEGGISDVPGKRKAIAEAIIEKAVMSGIKPEDIIVDPVAMAVSAEPRACLVTLDTIRMISSDLGHNITMGSSNISFGLPGRESLNAAFLTLAVYCGLTCPIANPEKITSAARATDLILGRDDYAVRFVEYFQNLT